MTRLNELPDASTYDGLIAVFEAAIIEYLDANDDHVDGPRGAATNVHEAFAEARRRVSELEPT